MEKISLKADDAFKELFAHEKVRKQFLSDVLGIPLEQIKSVRLANPFLRNREGEELTDLWEVHIIELGKELTGNRIDDWIRLFNATSQEEVDRIAEQNGRMRDVAEVVRQMGLIRTIRWFYDGYWRAKRDRWAEDEYVRDEGIAIGEARGREAGKAEGKAEGAEAILQLLQNINKAEKVPQELTQKIGSEKDEETLKRWILSAAKAESVEQFKNWEDL